MADSFSKQKRSEIMSKIRSKNTKLEVDFRKRIWRKGLRYRLHYSVSGKPDLVFPSKKIAVFIDSCFWHKCPKHFRQPKTNLDYWVPKINRNVERDRETTKRLKREGWEVLRFWEHEIKRNRDKCVETVGKTWTREV